MDKRLDIHLFIQPNCQLVAVDNSDYNSLGVDLLEHVMLEFLSYNDENNPLLKTIKLRKEIHNRGYYLAKFSSKFILDVDGTYSYYKLVIPVLDHFYKEDKYKGLNNELFFYNGKIYKSNLNRDEETDDVSYILENSEEIINYIEAYELVQNGGASQTFYCPKENVFSVCKLQRCLVSLQRQLLLTNKCDCGRNNCNDNVSLRNQRDFLLSALYVFDYLKDIRNFTEAQRILDNLSACGSICGDKLNDLNNDCGCGNSV